MQSNKLPYVGVGANIWQRIPVKKLLDATTLCKVEKFSSS